MEERTESTDPLSSSRLEHPLQNALASDNPGSSPAIRGEFGSSVLLSDNLGVTGSRLKLGIDDVTTDIEGIIKLMKNGSWRNVLKLCDKCIPVSKYRHDTLQLRLCKLTAQMKMRMYKAVEDELHEIGDFDGPPNCFETYPNIYPGLRGSMAPFAMRIIAAELPYFAKTGSSLDSLFELLSLCRKQVKKLKNNESKINTVKIDTKIPDFLTPLPSPSQCSFISTDVGVEDIVNISYQENLETWLLRENRIVFIIATRLIQDKEYVLAMSLLQDMLNKFPQDPSLNSCMGRMHLQMGNVKAASAMFKYVESLVPDPKASALVLMNSGYLSVAMEQFSLAIDHFQGVLEIEPDNLVAANNKAICWLYTCDLTRAIYLLEELIRKDPERNLTESLAFNLCTLYDLKTELSQERKKNVMSLVAKFASDSFDFSVLKLSM